MSYKDKKSLIIYFSREYENYAVGYIDKGNTEVIAEFIRDYTGADMFKVERKIPYSKDYRTCVKEASAEIKNNEDVELVSYLADISKYEVIYIGGPVYCGYLPQPMVSQLKRLDFNGKIVRIFTTHEGSGTAHIPAQIAKMCPGANIIDTIAIRGKMVNGARSEIEKWI